VSWGFYNRFLEGDRVFLLVYGKRMYAVIPKSASRTPPEWSISEVW
jgi:hypothetical protein